MPGPPGGNAVRCHLSGSGCVTRSHPVDECQAMECTCAHTHAWLAGASHASRPMHCCRPAVVGWGGFSGKLCATCKTFYLLTPGVCPSPLLPPVHASFPSPLTCFCHVQAFVQRQGYDYVRLDGSTPQKLRQGICDEFNSRPSIFLLLMSTVAGGLGLNLTAANKVVSNMMASPSLIPLQSGMGTFCHLCATDGVVAKRSLADHAALPL